MRIKTESRILSGRRLVAFSLLLSVLFASVAALDVRLHRIAHGELSDVPESTNCVIALFEAGSVSAASAEPVLPVPGIRLEFSAIQPRTVVPEVDFISRANVRAPPFFLISV